MGYDYARTGSQQVSDDRQKKYGETFTPIKLVNEMLDQIPAEMWLPGKTVLEPAAGDGNFVIEILKRKLAAGCTPLEAISDVYAIEYHLDNVQEMRWRVLDLLGDTKEIRKMARAHLVCANTLDPSDNTDGRCYPEWLKNEDN